jgi:hypothetical protein
MGGLLFKTDMVMTISPGGKFTVFGILIFSAGISTSAVNGIQQSCINVKCLREMELDCSQFRMIINQL